MKITMLAGYYAPEKSADTHLNVDLAESFSRLGAEVTVLVPFPSRGIDDKEQAAYLSRRDERVSDTLRILRVGEPAVYHKSLLRRGLALLKKSMALYRAARRTQTDAYFIVSTPPFLGYFGALLSKRAPVVYLLHDVFPDSLALSGKLREGSVPMRALHRVERWMYRRLTHIDPCSEDIKTTLLSRGVPAEKLTVVSNWADPDECVGVARSDNPLFDRYGLSRDWFYVSYGGNLGHLQNAETILRAAQRLQSVPAIRFALIGDGARAQALREQCREMALQNVDWLPLQSDVSAVYSFGDVELVSLKAGVTRIAMPSKTWSILSAARPVICEAERNSGLVRLLEQLGCGVGVEPGDDAALADAVLALYRLDAAQRERMGAAGREYICSHLNREQATRAHFDVLERMIKERT